MNCSETAERQMGRGRGQVGIGNGNGKGKALVADSYAKVVFRGREGKSRSVDD